MSGMRVGSDLVVPGGVGRKSGRVPNALGILVRISGGESTREGGMEK